MKIKTLKTIRRFRLNSKANQVQIPKTQLEKIKGGSSSGGNGNGGQANGEIEDYQVIVIDL